MKKWVDRFNGALLALMFLTTFYQVLVRNVLFTTAMWTEELAKILFVYVVFLGSATLMENEGHIKIAFLSDRLPARLARWHRSFAHLVLVAFGVIFVWSSWLNALNNWEFYSPSMNWFRLAYLYLGLVVSGLLTLFYLLLNMVRNFFPGRFGVSGAK
ncbi:MAG TPA: TRAP transporter small permease [Thermodesulfobacteriota bacterium]|nr:TRAP transporter small permease [Thermodesulfobacteriota bacterium]